MSNIKVNTNAKEVTDKFITNSGVPLKEEYTPEELEQLKFDFQNDLGKSGEYPFTRGNHKGMYRDELWIMGQYSGFGSAEEANKRFRYLLKQGQTGFAIALDLPTQIGIDSDNELSAGEVGKVGVAINSLADIEKLFNGIPLEKVRQIRTTANSIAPIITAFLIAFAEKNAIEPNAIKILLQNDPLKEYFARGTYIFPPKAAVKLTVDVIEYASKYMPEWVPISLSGYHIRESGGTATQEIAFCFANGISYIEEALARGLNIDDFAPILSTFLSTHIELFEEIAKFRAARRVWAKMMREKFGAKNPDSMKLRIVAYTSGGTLTAQQPLNNIVRVTLEALAAVLGGVQTLATSSFDEAVSIPTEKACTVALRTQQIIAQESGVTKTVDPVGGSYALETLTLNIEEQIKTYIHKIIDMGGAVRCVENGFFQKELAHEAHQFQKSIEQKDRIWVGVNEYKEDEHDEIPVFQTDPALEKKYVKNLIVMREGRDKENVKKRLERIRDEAKNGKNIIPSVIEAAKSYATIGEITNILKDVFGTYHDPGGV